MSKNLSAGLFVVLLIIVVAVLDVLSFRNYFWARLGANIGWYRSFSHFI